MSKIIFYNDTGFPYSVLAAAIRSGLLPRDRLPEKQELFGVLQRYGMGKGEATVFDLGCDLNNEKCLAMWSRGDGDMTGRIIKSFLGLFQIRDYRLVRLDYPKTYLLRAGVILTKFPGLRPLGRQMIHRAVKSVYRKLLETAS
ncbi:Protein of unknown function [Desulfotomaculum arcticum]|uniref:Uncharacterized protein n=1 Tax=Desulfotruncus arcticus DSM 17038 TaxID=1121424 RepID=A0A1I2N0K2_9FIRM|nr:DUF3189 family protein [Desulfotruncus arcticus]SFF94901.1 Protein of unknown function [Desulfotomaculum arcticum] [Desulfotruncus arcticus DSM 17038]